MLDEQGAVFISANLSEDPRLSMEARQTAGAMALGAVPIWCEHRITAVLQLARPVGTSFAVADVERLAQIADHAGAGYQTAKAGEALRKSEERYRRLFSAATDAIVTLDRTGVITSFNEAAERLWHVHARTVVGGRWDVVLPFEAPEVVAEQVGRVLGGASCAFEAGLRRPDGERGVLALTISPLVEDGQTTTVLCIVRDVTDQRRVQAQLLQAEKMSAIGQLVGGMAHERAVLAARMRVHSWFTQFSPGQLPDFGLCVPYSLRSAASGSTRVARRAGIQHVARVINMTTSTIPARVSGSAGPIPKR